MPSAGSTRRLICLVATLCAGCASGPAEPPTDFPFARATPECGPADGPAVLITLLRDTMPELPPGSPRVRVFLWHPPGDLTGEEWSVGGSSQDGFAEYADGVSTTPLRGTVTVTAVRADSTIEGEVDLTSTGSLAIRGGFRAVWVTRELLCG